MGEEDYYLGFAVFPGIGPKKFSQLLERFISAEKAWNAKEQELEEILKPVLTKQFLSFRSSFDIVKYHKILNKHNISFLPRTSDSYPPFLLSIENPPIVLFYKGENLFTSDIRRIGIVGTRNVTSYGRQVTEMLTREIVSSGCYTISGLALGIDAIAHTTTVESGGKTIAVLGCGVECCYPSSNQQLYSRILSTGGMILSEFPLNQSPSKGSFPARNRIIAALSDALLVTEGAEDSGSLITAEFALEFGKPVFAVPGPITSQLSKGPNRLIAKRAKMVTSGEDLLKELGIKNHELRRTKKQIKGETEEEQKIIDLLENESMNFDEIVRKTGMVPQEVGVVLSLMEVKGTINANGLMYSLSH